ncbi:metal ABC transporter permease [Vibrio sp. HN007]|uniref:metal ABC transporter permease n=1 Tax=Vibrio iocasae TaxID=3098914 RepID=UPI0035D41C78
MLDYFVEPFQYLFMQRALIAGLAVSVICAVLSCYMVLKRWALMGDAISHAVLPGVVVAHLFSLPLILGAFISGMGCALLTGYIKEHSRIKEDTIMGIVFSSMFALGLVMFAKTDSGEHLMHILFGNMLGVSEQGMWQVIVVSALVLFVVGIKFKDLLLYCFDQSHAKVSGLNVSLLHYLLLSMIALTIVASIQIVGVILVVAMLIGPGMTASLLSRKFEQMVTVALLISVVSTFIGIVVSFHIDGATSACIVLTQALLFVCTFIYSITFRNRKVTRTVISREAAKGI